MISVLVPDLSGRLVYSTIQQRYARKQIQILFDVVEKTASVDPADLIG